jgi:HNH endonuclease
MLHPVKPVICLAEMNKLLQFQRGVLKLCIELANGASLNENTFKLVLNIAPGAWLWKTRAQNQNWRNVLEGLTNAFAADSRVQGQTLDSFDNDITFQDHLSDPAYSFQFPDLPVDLKKAIKALFELFYDYTYSTGYDKSIHGNSDFLITRKSFIQSYEDEKSNGLLYVCPVCDKEISDEDIDSKTAVCQLDHFFPKSIYPFLSMHPYNLIPVCEKCNSIKSFCDPLADGIHPTATSGTFLNTYHPHNGRSIQELGQILVKRVNNSECQSLIQDKELSFPQRADSAQRVYKLSTRWKSRLNMRPGVVARLISSIQDLAKEKRARSSYTIEEMLKDLDFVYVQHNNASPGHHVLRNAYVKFALSDAEEQKYLFQEYRNSA